MIATIRVFNTELGSYMHYMVINDHKKHVLLSIQLKRNGKAV